MALSISLISCSRGLPPDFAGGIKGSRMFHSRSLRSLGYCFLFTLEYYPSFPRPTPFKTPSKIGGWLRAGAGAARWQLGFRLRQLAIKNIAFSIAWQFRCKRNMLRPYGMGVINENRLN